MRFYSPMHLYRTERFRCVIVCDNEQMAYEENVTTRIYVGVKCGKN